MTQELQIKTTADLLNAAYKNVKSATELILTLMPKVKNEALKSDMTVQLCAWEAFASRAVKQLAEENSKPEDAGMIPKLSAKWGAMVNTVMDSSTAHLAQLLIDGANSRMRDLTEAVRDAEHTKASEASLRLMRDVCAFEEKIIKDLKVYL